MNQKEQDAWIRLLVIGTLVVAIIITWLQLAWISFTRFVFWFDIVFIPIFFVTIIVSMIGFVNAPEYDRGFWGIVGGISIVLLLITSITIAPAYNQGYSDEAIQKKAELEKRLADYKLILSVYTGEFRLEVQGMVLEEVNNALCEALPEKPCAEVVKSYNAYQELVGLKKGADLVAFWTS